MEKNIEIFTIGLLLIVGLSHIARPRAWVEFFTLLRTKGQSGAFIVAMLNLLPGLFIVSLHPGWSGIAAVVTLLGWGWTIKGSIYFIFPDFALKMLGNVSLQNAHYFVIGGWVILGLAAAISYSLVAA